MASAHTVAREAKHAGGPDRPGRTVDQHGVAGLDARDPQALRVETAIGGRRGLLERERSGLEGDEPVSAHHGKLRPATEPEAHRPEHSVADLEPRRGATHRRDLAGEIRPEDGLPRAAHAGDQPADAADERAAFPIRLARVHVGAGDAGRADLHEDLVRLGLRLRHVGDAQHVRRAVAVVHGRLHRRER